MKKIITAVIFGLFIQVALSAPVSETNTNTSLKRPVPQEYYRRFVAIDNIYGRGFYWLDSTTGQLREFDRSLSEWQDHGIQKGMKPGPNGTYALLGDTRGGVYVLNTRTGQGWWFDETRWESIDKED